MLRPRRSIKMHHVLGLSAVSLKSLCKNKWLLKLGWGWHYVRSNMKIAESRISNTWHADWLYPQDGSSWYTKVAHMNLFYDLSEYAWLCEKSLFFFFLSLLLSQVVNNNNNNNNRACKRLTSRSLSAGTKTKVHVHLNLIHVQQTETYKLES